MTLPDTEAGHTRRCEVVDPLTRQSPFDYADAFEVTLRDGDGRTAEEIFRAGMQSTPSRLGGLVLLAHRHVLGFRLGPPESPNHIVGWQITRSEHDLLQLRADGPLFTGTMVARRVDERTARLTTSLVYRQPHARIVWAIVGPVHRGLAPRLLRHAALRSAVSA
jgi:hypothetical protein